MHLLALTLILLLLLLGFPKFLQNPGPAKLCAISLVTYKEQVRIGLYLASAWADADGSQEEDRHAITGYAFLIDGGAVSQAARNNYIVYD